MKQSITLCIVGAGSSYTPELIEGLLMFAHEELPIVAIRLQDVNVERMAVMAGLAQRMIAHARRDIAVRSGRELEPLLDGVDFVVTQIRVGGMAARVIDEKIPLQYGIIGQETTGPGGMFKALRTIPPMLEIARTVERAAPQAFILNYTNPSGIITEAVRHHTNARLIGLCSGIPDIQTRLKKLLADRYPHLRTFCVGLNHLGFIHKFLDGDRNVTREALDRLLELSEAQEAAARFPNPDVLRTFDAVALGYLGYYIDRRQRVEDARAAGLTRAEVIMEIEQRIFEEARDPQVAAKPAALASRGGDGYSDITFRFLQAIHGNTGQELVCTVPNQGAVEGIDADAGVEIVCTVDGNGPHPLPVGPIPLAFRGLVQAVKAYETLTVEAAVTRRRKSAVQALVNHPLVGDLKVAESLVDEMLAAHGLNFT